MPPRPATPGFPWAESRTATLSKAEQTAIVVQTPAWANIVRPACQALDAETKGQRGPSRAYTAEQLETVFLYGRVCGLNRTEDIRARLAGDVDPDVRRILDFEERDPLPGQRRAAGVPSIATLNRHKRRMTAKRRAIMYRNLLNALRAEYLALPGVADSCRVLQLDGTDLMTHFQGSIRDKDGNLLNSPRMLLKHKRRRGMTAKQAGYRGGKRDDDHKAGHGWQLLPLLNAEGLPLAEKVAPINEAERTVAKRLLNQFERLQPALPVGPEQVSVLTADTNFHSPAFSARLHRLGVVPNIHSHSHADRESTTQRVAAARRSVLPIKRYPNWRADGLRQLSCKCGEGTVVKRVERTGGKLVMRLEGSCEACGPCNITAGRWRKASNAPAYAKPEKKNQGWFVPMQPGESADQADWQFGNYLTYDNPDSRAYGEQRFGHQEGFNGTLGSRFGLGAEKSWHRTRAAVEVDVYQTFATMFALTLAEARRAKPTPLRPPAPPPLPEAAAA